MPIYEYETVPAKKGEKPKRYEIRQSLSDKPLTRHPETGETLVKVFTAFAVGGSSSGAASSGGGCCGGGCGCHHN